MFIIHVPSPKLRVSWEDGEAYPSQSGFDQGTGFIPLKKALSAGVIQVDGYNAVAEGLNQFKQIWMKAGITIPFYGYGIRPW